MERKNISVRQVDFDRYWFRLTFSVLFILTPISYSSLHYCLYSSECHGSFSLLYILLLTWRWVYLKHLVVFCLHQNMTQSVQGHSVTTSWSEYTFLWLLLCCFFSLQASVSSSFLAALHTYHTLLTGNERWRKKASRERREEKPDVQDWCHSELSGKMGVKTKKPQNGSWYVV